MKLYFAPGTCSLSPQIVAAELGIQCDYERVRFATKTTQSGEDYNQINPKGSVPALRLDNGQLLTEGAVIVQYLADQKPQAGLMPAAGTLERYRAQEMLTFIATEIHKGFSPLFNRAWSAEVKSSALARLETRLEIVNQLLQSSPYLCGEAYTVADPYLFTVLGWAPVVGLELSKWPAIVAYLAKIGERPAVKAAQAIEQAAKAQA